VVIDGRNVYSLPAAELIQLRWQAIGFMFQPLHLIPHLTAMENVMAASTPRNGRPNGTRARDLLHRFGLDQRRDHHPHQLSIGQQQRVALAGALMNDPRMLLCDEPTGKLDDRNAQMVMESLAKLAEEEGKTVVAVTSDGRIRLAAHRVLHMAQGQLVGEFQGSRGAEAACCPLHRSTGLWKSPAAVDG